MEKKYYNNAFLKEEVKTTINIEIKLFIFNIYLINLYLKFFTAKKNVI
jgi:hypothetical protein